MGPAACSTSCSTALNGSIGHLVGGYPEFDGWPRWNNYTGQQAYVDWLKRSWLGGERLMSDAGREQRGPLLAGPPTGDVRLR